ncbi:hypothetical protein GCM10023259_055470 [Thermocatellispora tengchongensis]
MGQLAGKTVPWKTTVLPGSARGRHPGTRGGKPALGGSTGGALAAGFPASSARLEPAEALPRLGFLDWWFRVTLTCPSPASFPPPFPSPFPSSPSTFPSRPAPRGAGVIWLGGSGPGQDQDKDQDKDQDRTAAPAATASGAGPERPAGEGRATRRGRRARRAG